MLDVTYEAVDYLEPGRLARIDVDRGKVRVLLDESQPLKDVVRQLNIEADELMATCTWFQLWGTEIVSRNTPDAPLRVQYCLVEEAPHGVGIGEDKGIVTIYISTSMDTKAFAASMNPAADDFLSGGHWFQLHDGEIIDNGPEPMSRV
jgi:hypothetical protein